MGPGYAFTHALYETRTRNPESTLCDVMLWRKSRRAVPRARLPPEPMQAYVYKSLRKADTYVYLAQRDDFARLPEPLRTQLGTLHFVLEVALTPERKLAREDAAVVRENLALRGFHLQFPPKVEDPMLEDWGTDA